MSSNDPFGGNAQNPYSFSDTPQVQLPPDMQRGLVHHVTALSILTIVQGTLVLLYGIGLSVLAFVMPAVMRTQVAMQGQPGMPAGAMPAGFEWMMMAIYGSMGLVSFVIGVLGIWAGIRMMKFRGRTFGIMALSSGLLSIAGCYCLPTAIGLFVYGLIVLLNVSVKRAFEMGEQGDSANEIQNHFARLPG